MKPKSKKIGFTIIELLTVMSIIVILISILVPSMNAMRRYSKVVLQKSQFHDISKCLEAYSLAYDGYPDSSWNDDANNPYCGAMKLCEAIAGQDGMGFHPDSLFNDVGQNINGADLYFVRTNTLSDPPSSQNKANLRNRDLCLEGDNVAQIAAVPEIYGQLGNFRSQAGGYSVICDMFKRHDLRRPGTGEKLGMPVLYYRADTTQLTHQYDQMPTNIYRYYDNHYLLEIPPPWIDDVNNMHPLWDSSGSPPPANCGQKFYEVTRNPDVIVQMVGGTYPQPYNRDSFILISAGWDGLYGTRDDVFNFEKK